MRKCERNIPADTKTYEEETGGDVADADGEVHGVAGCPPVAHGGPCCSRFPQCNQWRSPQCCRYICSAWRCSPCRVHARGGFWVKLWLMGDSHWNRLFLKDCMPRYRSILEQFLKKNYILWEGTVHEGLHLMGGTPCWKRGKCEKARAAETSWDGLPTTPQIP